MKGWFLKDSSRQNVKIQATYQFKVKYTKQENNCGYFNFPIQYA